MKRCPQCEFIYEDDQTCCDMDGISLVFDHPTASTAVTKTDSPVKPNRSRRSALFSICAVILGVLVLAIGYASLESAITVNSEPVSTSEAAPQSEPQENLARRPLKAVPVVEPVAVDPAGSAVAEKAKTTNIEAREFVRNSKSSSSLQRNSLGTRGVILGSIPPQNRVDPSRSQSEMVRPREPVAPAKKDSKVVSVVKKTGKLLTKPFRL